MLFRLLGSLTTVSYGATMTLGMPRARALRLKILRLAMDRRARKAAAIAAKFAKWVEEVSKKTQETHAWLKEKMQGVRTRAAACCAWFRRVREHRRSTATPLGEDLEPA